ncbi:hypothetical protein ACWEKT_02855 [Nocardia takedensis]
MVENWVENGHAAIRAAIDGDAFVMNDSLSKLIEDPDEPMALVRASFMWCGMLLAAMPLASLMKHAPPREQMNEYSRWVIDLLTAREAGDGDAAHRLYRHAGVRGWDWFTEALIALITLTAQRVRAREAFYRRPGR